MNLKSKLASINTSILAKGLLVLSLIILIAISYNTIAVSNPDSTKESVTTDRSSSNANYNAQVNIKAESAVVWDKNLNTVIYNKNGNRTLAVASVTKVLTAIVAMEKLQPEDVITITQSDLKIEGESGLIAGEQWDRDELVVFMLITSSNDAAEAIAREVSIREEKEFSLVMNEVGKDIGLKDSKWVNATGLDVIDGQVASNYSTANEIIILLDHLLTQYPDIAYAAGETTTTFTTNMKQHQARSTNQIGLDLPHTLSAKTGFTYVAGGNLAVITDVGLSRPIFIVVLNSTYEDRFSDVERLYNLSTDIIQS